MYVAQNFDVPKVDDPEKVIEKVTKLFGEAKKEVEDAKKKIDKWLVQRISSFQMKSNVESRNMWTHLIKLCCQLTSH